MWNYISPYCRDLFKVIYAFIIAFITPVIPLLIIIGIFVLIDTYYGIKAAKCSNIKITSRRAARIIDKTLKYGTVILLFHAINIYIFGSKVFLIFGIPFTLPIIVAVIILILELFSIDESLRTINNGQGIKYQTIKILKVILEFKKIKKEITSDETNTDNTDGDIPTN